MTTPKNGSWDRISKRIFEVAVLAIAAAVIHLEIRVGIIESNHFTNKDGTELERRMREEIPPEWLKQDLEELKSGQKDLLQRMIRLESQVNK